MILEFYKLFCEILYMFRKEKNKENQRKIEINLSKSTRVTPRFRVERFKKKIQIFYIYY